MRQINLITGVRATVVAVAVLMLASDRPMPLHAEALARIASDLESKAVRLKVDLHEPDPGSDSMQAPTLERRGWHHHNPSGAVALRAGSRVVVTGVFNYSERGIFLELSREEPGAARPPITARARVRVRIMVETPNTDPEGQRVEAIDLIGKVIELPQAP